MSALARAAFAAGAGGAGWVLAGYPAALGLLPRRPWATGSEQPPVTILIPAFREHEALRRKLAALELLDYPSDRLQVIVAVDEDEELAALVARVRPGALVSFGRVRAGKAAALTRALADATGEIVLLTDANNVLEPGSVAAAVRHFADPRIWAVAGRRGEQDSPYDRYEDLIRRLESRSGSVAAMSGEFMAVRREHLPAFPAYVVNDDLWLLGELVRAGGRVVYEPEAGSVEEPVGTRAEMARRSRIGAGRAMLLGELRGMPKGFVLRVLSHKHGRLALPFLLVLALLASLAGSRSGRGLRMAAAAQLAGYGLGVASGLGARLPGPLARIGRAAWQFTLGNAAIGVGVVRAARGRQDVRWEAVR